MQREQNENKNSYLFLTFTSTQAGHVPKFLGNLSLNVLINEVLIEEKTCNHLLTLWRRDWLA